MDSVKDSLNALTEMFQHKMAGFQQDLDNAPTENTPLATEFRNFRTFVISAMNTLQKQVEFLGYEVDRLETRRRRKMLLFHGVSEEKSEDVTARICSLVGEHLGVAGFTADCITASHRMGRPSEHRARPIVVKFADVTVRDKVWFSKAGFKGSGITESEFLTKSRHTMFLEARKKYGISKSWTREGIIHIITPDGSRHKVECRADLDSIASSASAGKPQALQTNTSTSRPKRAVRK